MPEMVRWIGIVVGSGRTKWGVAHEPVALGHRLLHEAELAVLQIPHTAVDHVAGCRGRAAHVVVAFHEGDVDALQREVAERRDAVDSTPDDENVRVGAVLQGLDVRTDRRLRLGHRSSFRGFAVSRRAFFTVERIYTETPVNERANDLNIRAS
jgi:hypothetical protein